MLEAKVINSNGIDDLALVNDATGNTVRVVAEVYDVPLGEWLARLFNQYHPCEKCGEPCDRRNPVCPACEDELTQLYAEHSLELVYDVRPL